VQRREVREQGGKVARGTRRVDLADSIGVLVGVQTPGGQVLTQVGSGFLSLRVSDP
jgi:hypothetical protein